MKPADLIRTNARRRIMAAFARGASPHDPGVAATIARETGAAVEDVRRWMREISRQPVNQRG